jgi:flagellar protein FlaJ
MRGGKIIGLAHWLAYKYPNLKKELKMAHINEMPDMFIDKNLKKSLLFAILFTILFFFMLEKANLSRLWLILVFVVTFFISFNFGFLKLKGLIKRREKEINQEILFIGRYLLVKLYAGKPILNALMETAKSRGIAAKSIKEIVDDINVGSPLEEALENAATYSPSEKFRKILFQINNALRLGIDVTKPLESVIEEITKDQEIEIKKYGKKLNTMVVFYMLVAVVIPSIGMVMFIILSSFLNFLITFKEFSLVLFFITLIQLFFISIFKSIKPMVDL